MKKLNHIQGRRWQDSFGNTYHTATLFFADGSQEKSKITYGYSDGYLQTAVKMLGLEGQKGTTRYVRETLGATYNATDVARKKDL